MKIAYAVIFIRSYINIFTLLLLKISKIYVELFGNNYIF